MLSNLFMDNNDRYTLIRTHFLKYSTEEKVQADDKHNQKNVYRRIQGSRSEIGG